MRRSSGRFYVPNGRYTRDSFQRKLVEHSKKLFSRSKKRKWVKVHGVRTYPNRWQDVLKEYRERDMGQVWHITLPISETTASQKMVDFYVCAYSPELLLFYTASTNDEYEKTLSKLIDSTKGFGRMWIGPTRFESLVMHYIDTFKPIMERFIASRSRSDTFPAKVRKDQERLVQWSADDSYQTLYELREMYGVRPTAVTLRLEDGKFYMRNDGVFTITRLNETMFQSLDDTLSFIGGEEQILTLASQRIQFKTDVIKSRTGQLVVPQIVSGSIRFGENKLNSISVQNLRQEGKFDYIGSRDHEGSYVWAATIVDRDKGSVFGLSSNEETMRLIPRYNVTFESLLDFYSEVQERIDPTATFSVFGNETR